MSVDLRVLVVDDEAVSRRRAARLVTALEGVELVGECAGGDELLARLRDDDIDLVLLDIEMPGLSGIDLKALLPEGAPLVIFVTAHPEHAVRAFDVGADDYVLKPLEAARLAKAVARARQRLEGAPAAGTLARHLGVKTRDGVVLLAPAELTHALVEGEIVTIHAAGKAYFSDVPLGELAARLPADRFERVHRRALLNLDFVAKLEALPSGGYLAHLSTGPTVEVSRQAARRLRRRLGVL